MSVKAGPAKQLCQALMGCTGCGVGGRVAGHACFPCTPFSNACKTGRGSRMSLQSAPNTPLFDKINMASKPVPPHRPSQDRSWGPA